MCPNTVFFPGPYFPVFGLNAEIYEVIQDTVFSPNAEIYGSEKTSYLDTFHAMLFTGD